MNGQSTDDTDRTRDWVSIVALGWVTVVLAFVTGPIGVVAGFVTAGAWYALGTPYAIAAGTVVLAVATPDPSATTVGGVTLAFLALVLARTVRSDRPLAEIPVVLASAGGLVGIAWVLGRSQPLWVAAGTLLGCIAFAAYTLHRYELVRLGLVPDAVNQPSEETEP